MVPPYLFAFVVGSDRVHAGHCVVCLFFLNVRAGQNTILVVFTVPTVHKIFKWLLPFSPLDKKNNSNRLFHITHKQQGILHVKT